MFDTRLNNAEVVIYLAFTYQGRVMAPLLAHKVHI
jgi:hypothetical protein